MRTFIEIGLYCRKTKAPPNFFKYTADLSLVTNERQQTDDVLDAFRIRRLGCGWGGKTLRLSIRDGLRQHSILRCHCCIKGLAGDIFPNASGTARNRSQASPWHPSILSQSRQLPALSMDVSTSLITISIILK